jgi:hypothetical protein
MIFAPAPLDCEPVDSCVALSANKLGLPPHDRLARQNLSSRICARDGVSQRANPQTLWEGRG